jgi:gamma-glutamyltranspeptidase/glutathione hydrolase
MGINNLNWTRSWPIASVTHGFFPQNQSPPMETRIQVSVSSREKSLSTWRKAIAFIALGLLSLNGVQAQRADPPAFSGDLNIPDKLPTFGPVVSEGDMVATAHPLASQIGLGILEKGGNAFDAAAAVAVALGILLSDQTDGITGEGSGLFYIAKTHEIKALNWDARIPDNPAFAARAQQIHDQDNPVNLVAPGALAGMNALLKNLGTMSLAQILQPSIEYCERGIPVRPELRSSIAHRADVFRKDPRTASIFLPNDQVPPIGYALKMPNEARSLRLIASQGPDVLYKGELDKQILAFSKEVGGLLTQKDMDYAANPRWVTPITTTYHGYTVYALPPPAGGIPLIEVMNILEGFKLKSMSEAERTHVLAETFKISMNDMETYFGDPERTKAREGEILSKSFAANQRTTIQPDKVLPWSLVPDDTRGGGTTNFEIVDAQGNVAAITNTRSSWGIAHVSGNTGLFLHAGTRLMSANPNHPMFVKPGKSLQKSITPMFVFDAQHRLIMATGAAGGRTITHTNAQILVNVLDLGMNMQQALTAPRVSYDGAGAKLNVSYGFHPPTVEMLHKLGHDFVFREEGVAQGITIDPATGARIGGADPRTSGLVAAR